MTNDAKTMLRLLGVPVIESFCEAEAQCVALVKAGKADAVASEDMDCLTFGAPLLLRGFSQRKNKGDPIFELELPEMLKELGLSMDEFIDFCILCGSDYTKHIEGLGPSGAFKLIKEHRTIEKVLEELRARNAEKVKEGKAEKYTIPAPERFDYVAARAEFKACKSNPAEDIEIVFGEPDDKGLKEFLCEKKGFSETRVESGLEKLRVAKKSGVQSSLEAFFGKPTKVSQPGTKNKDKKSLNMSTKRGRK